MNLLKFSRLQEAEKNPITPEALSNVMSDGGTKVFNILTQLGCTPHVKSNGWIEARCPNHHVHAGHTSTQCKFNLHPTGFTHCFTGNYSSNIIQVLAEVWNVSPQEVIDKLHHEEYVNVVIPQVHKPIEAVQDRSEALARGIKMVQTLLKTGHISDECLSFFATDGITKATLDFLGVCSIETGVLAGRAIIPFLDDKKEVCGYVAVNYMGKDWWIKTNYDKYHKIDDSITIEEVEKRYKKALYCPGFTSRNHLYGLYEVLNGGKDVSSLMLVEGERDAIKMLQEGIDCVSIHGTSLKDEQFEMLINMPNLTQVYIGLDMDEAGRTGAKLIRKKLKPYYDEVKILSFPDGKDPKKFNHQEMINIINNN